MYTAAAMLLSRQSLRPTRQTPWVRQTLAAIKWVREFSPVVASSVGLQTWNLITAAASLEGTRLRIVVPVTEDSLFEAACRDITTQFALAHGSSEYIPVLMPNSASDKATSLLRRDRAVVHCADMVIPIAVRPSGNMEELITLARTSGKTIVDSFALETAESSSRLAQDFSRLRLRSGVDDGARDMIIHWTRGTSSKWPGEREIDLWRAVLAADVWPRDGLCTLERMVRDTVILASPRHMPDNRPCVCFSALAPSTVLPLMRWRARYHEMSFEPYGVGIHKEAAKALGIAPVIYTAADEGRATDADERWRYQSVGLIGDWRAEYEWRLPGHVSLSELPTEAVRVFCRTADEAARLREFAPYEVVPLFEE